MSCSILVAAAQTHFIAHHLPARHTHSLCLLLLLSPLSLPTCLQHVQRSLPLFATCNACSGRKSKCKCILSTAGDRVVAHCGNVGKYFKNASKLMHNCICHFILAKKSVPSPPCTRQICCKLVQGSAKQRGRGRVRAGSWGNVSVCVCLMS